eukprot:PhM_4_TR14925/c0_g1_i1/m.61439
MYGDTNTHITREMLRVAMARAQYWYIREVLSDATTYRTMRAECPADEFEAYELVLHNPSVTSERPLFPPKHTRYHLLMQTGEEKDVEGRERRLLAKARPHSAKIATSTTATSLIFPQQQQSSRLVRPSSAKTTTTTSMSTGSSGRPQSAPRRSVAVDNSINNNSNTTNLSPSPQHTQSRTSGLRRALDAAARQNSRNRLSSVPSDKTPSAEEHYRHAMFLLKNGTTEAERHYNKTATAMKDVMDNVARVEAELMSEKKMDLTQIDIELETHYALEGTVQDKGMYTDKLTPAEERDNQPFVLELRGKGGAPSRSVHQRRDDLGGAIMQCNDVNSQVSHDRRLRWIHLFENLDEMEKALQRMEHNAQVASPEIDHVVHPSKISDSDKASILREGLGSEAEEMSVFLTTWVSDVLDRTNVLVMHEQMRINTRIHNLHDKGCQTDESGSYGPGGGEFDADMFATSMRPGGGRAATATIVSQPPPQPSVASSRGDLRRHMSFGGRSGDGDEPSSPLTPNFFAVGTTSFQRAMRRTVASMRIQALWKGYKARKKVGNLKLKIRTFFHSRDPRIRDLWIATSKTTTERTALWVANLCATLIRAKLTSDYINGTHTTNANGETTQIRSASSFVDFTFKHLFDAYNSESVVNENVKSFLVGLSVHSHTNCLLRVVMSFFMAFWSERYHNLLIRTLLAIGKVLAAAGVVLPDAVTPTNYQVDLEGEHRLSLQNVRVIVRSLFPHRMDHSVVLDLVFRTLELAAKDPNVGGVSPLSAETKSCTVRELLFALLHCVKEDRLVSNGY